MAEGDDIIAPVKGTRDFYPEDMAMRAYLLDKIRKVSESFGYQEYDGPALEKLELYAAKSGEELVNQQSFVFADRGGDMITLRPELTPTLARMIAQRQKLEEDPRNPVHVVTRSGVGYIMPKLDK